jgi:dienelactone hydrolase
MVAQMSTMNKPIVSLSIIMLLLCSSVMFAGCFNQQKPVVTPKTTQELATDIVTLLIQQNYSGAYSYFNTSITRNVTEKKFQDVWKQVTNTSGTLTRIVSERSENQSRFEVVYVTCNFSKSPQLDIKIVFNSQHKVIGLTIVPPKVTYKVPSYVNQSMFSEHSVIVGSSPWTLPGNLTIPKGTGPFPAVVLVQGSGPNDQDETIGPNKPLKDLAWGLASRGIVVLRYAKRTIQYPQQSAKIQNFTVEDEVIDDVIAAIDILNETQVVDHSRIFVLGHSLGGYLAPRIATQDHRIAGLIILAGPTRHLEDLILEQVRYLAMISHTNQSAQIAMVQRGIEKIKTLNFTDNESVFGAPRSYWRDLASYDPILTAETLHLPMLILQGLRDFQVIITDFKRWNQAFSSDKMVTLKTYTSLNHLFIAGAGTPSDLEYQIPGHVAEQVVNDTAQWIKAQ